jgi:hypothetical protein
MTLLSEARARYWVLITLTLRAGADDKEEFLATIVDQNNRTQKVGEAHNIDGWTKFDFPGRGDKYSEMKWVRRCVYRASIIPCEPSCGHHAELR